jgi:hypothetical protein
MGNIFQRKQLSHWKAAVAIYGINLKITEKIQMRKLFKPGESGNVAGKPPGAVNKVTAELGNMIDSFLKDNEQAVKDEFSKLSPFQKWKVYIELMGFRMPKLRAIEVSGEIDSLSDQTADNVLSELKRIYITNEYKDRIAHGSEGNTEEA